MYWYCISTDTRFVFALFLCLQCVYSHCSEINAYTALRILSLVWCITTNGNPLKTADIQCINFYFSKHQASQMNKNQIYFFVNQTKINSEQINWLVIVFQIRILVSKFLWNSEKKNMSEKTYYKNLLHQHYYWYYYK